MISRRHFMQASLATSFIFGSSGLQNSTRLLAQQKLSQQHLLDFEDFGNVTLIHITDVHGQLKPLYFREPDINIGVGMSMVYRHTSQVKSSLVISMLKLVVQMHIHCPPKGLILWQNPMERWVVWIE